MSFLSRRLVFVALTMAVCAFQAIAQFSVTMPYKQVTVQNINDIAKFSGASVAGKPGQPALPAYTVTFLLPPDADLSSVSVSINNSTEQELSGQYTVAPNVKIPGIDGKITWPKGMVVVDGKDMAVYGVNAFFPTDYKGVVRTGMMHQYRLVDIPIYPYLYNPVTKKLKMITGGTLNVTFKSGTADQNLTRNPDAEKILIGKVANPSEFNSYGYAPSSQLMLQSAQTSSVASAASQATVNAATASLSGGTYVIVTTNAIVNNTPALTNYKNMLTQKGANVVIATEDAWNFPSTSVTQEKCDNIRNYLTGKLYVGSKSGSPLKYVLLIGNPDTAVGDVPMKNWNGITDPEWATGIPTDYYYSDLSSNWSLGGPDLYGEASVGRIPVYNNNYNALNTFLTKVISYENASGYSAEWRRSYLGLAEILGFSPESYELSENIISTLKAKGWSYKSMYSSYSIIAAYNNFTLLPPVINMNPLADYTVINPPLVASVWNSEGPGLVVWEGHGWAEGTLNVVQSGTMGAYQENISQINTNYPAAVFAASCATEDPQDPNNCGAALLYRNAISYVGASVPVYTPSSTGFPYAINVGANIAFGDALVAAKATDSTLYFGLEHCLQFNLYGCPEAGLNLQTIDTTITLQNVKVTKSTTTLGFDITWNAVPGAAQYKIERSVTHSGAIPDGFALIGGTGSGVVKYTDGNIVTGTCYKYRVYAVNSSNLRGSYSQIDSATNFGSGQDLSCATPTNLSVTSVRSNMVNLSWTASVNAAYYNVKRSTSASGPFVTITSRACSDKTTTTTYTDYNVMNNVTYYYTVSAVNQYGQSANSAVVSATPTFILAVPSITSITDDYMNNLTINWSSDFNTVNYSFEWAYKFPDGTYGDFNVFGPIYEFGNTFTFSNVEPTCSNLGFRMRGFADDGSIATAYSNIYQFTSNWGPIPRCQPSTPTGLTATPSLDSITLNWSYVLSGDPYSVPTGCEFYCKQNGGSWQLFTTVYYPTQTASYIGVSPNTTYQFCARTIHNDPSSGINYYSPFTAIVSATTPPPDICSGTQGGGNGLKGYVFGLTPAWASGSEYCKATDGNTSTYYDYAQANGGYTGLDLGALKVIGKIRYYPRATFASRMVGGKFQGSNVSSSSGFVDLYTITATPAAQWNEVTITNSTPYRWVRYLSPNGGYCNIAEMEFYASQYTITSSPGSNGTISPSGYVMVNLGASQAFTITPNSGYKVSTVTVDGTNQGAITSYTFSNVTANHTISATFAATSTDPCSGVQGGGSGLHGTTFGLTPPYSAGSEYCKATDGDINTFYDYSQANGGYTGLDLGTAKVIGKIRYYPRSGWGARMTGGKFQGSNTSNSSGFVDLYTISGTPAVQWNDVTISNSTAYRWVRYLSPDGSYGNIAEMEFYAPTTQYTITASAGANGTISPSGSISVSSGASQSFTITPNSGYSVSAVTVDGSSPGAITSYTFTNVTTNHTISATFTPISPTFPDPTKWYKIATKANANQCLDVTGGSYANSTAIELWTKSNVNQEFQFKIAGNGYYTITCRGNTNYSIDMGGNFANGQTLELWATDSNNVNQKFKLVPISGGYYRIESSNSGYSIDNSGNTSNGTKPWLWTSDSNNANQQWVITVVP